MVETPSLFISVCLVDVLNIPKMFPQMAHLVPSSTPFSWSFLPRQCFLVKLSVSTNRVMKGLSRPVAENMMVCYKCFLVVETNGCLSI